MGKQKASFNLKLNDTKNQGYQAHKTEGNKRQSSNTTAKQSSKGKCKVQIKVQIKHGKKCKNPKHTKQETGRTWTGAWMQTDTMSRQGLHGRQTRYTNTNDKTRNR